MGKSIQKTRAVLILVVLFLLALIGAGLAGYAVGSS